MGIAGGPRNEDGPRENEPCGEGTSDEARASNPGHGKLFNNPPLLPNLRTDRVEPIGVRADSREFRRSRASCWSAICARVEEEGRRRGGQERSFARRLPARPPCPAGRPRGYRIALTIPPAAWSEPRAGVRARSAPWTAPRPRSRPRPTDGPPAPRARPPAPADQDQRRDKRRWEGEDT